MTAKAKRLSKVGAFCGAIVVAIALALLLPAATNGEPAGAVVEAKSPPAAARWAAAWPKTDFSRRSVKLEEIRSGGPPKDGIPPIDDPQFQSVGSIEGIAATEPVISLEIAGDARAYPLSVLMWHEIVNDTVGGVPVAVTFCPLCNAAVVFDRRLEGRVLDFGTTGTLRKLDLVMYDRQTESWWQQFLGVAIVGSLTGKHLKILPSRIESFAKFEKRFPKGQVLVPNDPGLRRYGANPYTGYDGLSRPFLYDGAMPANIAPLARVVSVGKEAWSLELLRKRKQIAHGDIVISWSAGQNSALDTARIAQGRDVGNVVVKRKTEDGLVDAVHGIDFAFAYHAFHPDGVIHVE